MDDLTWKERERASARITDHNRGRITQETTGFVDTLVRKTAITVCRYMKRSVMHKLIFFFSFLFTKIETEWICPPRPPPGALGLPRECDDFFKTLIKRDVKRAPTRRKCAKNKRKLKTNVKNCPDSTGGRMYKITPTPQQQNETEKNKTPANE